MLITWGEPKRLANLAKHGLDFAMIDEAFFGDALVVKTTSGRYVAVGRRGGRALTLVFKTLGTEAVALISLRPASKRERRWL